MIKYPLFFFLYLQWIKIVYLYSYKTCRIVCLMRSHRNIMELNVSIVRLGDGPLSFGLLGTDSIIPLILDDSVVSSSSSLSFWSLERKDNQRMTVKLLIEEDPVEVELQWTLKEASVGAANRKDPRLIPIIVVFLIELAFLIIIAFVLLY